MAATLDDLLDKLCRWHLFINLIAFLRGFPVTFNMMMPVFTAPRKLDYSCTNSSTLWFNQSLADGEKLLPRQCYYVPVDNGSFEDTNDLEFCYSWTYNKSFYGHTVVEEWDVVCDQAWKLSLSQSLYLAGLMIGTVIAGHCSDWFGRRRTILVGIIATAAFSVWTAFSTSFIMYNVARVALAFGVCAFGDITYALVMETVSPRYRYLPTISLGLGWSLGMLALPAMAYIVRDWHALQLYVCAPLGVMFLVWIFLPESPRWQIANGKYDAARKNLMRLAKCNDSPTETVDEVVENAVKKHNAQEIRKGSFIDLFSTKRWALTTSIFSFQLAVSTMVWYYTTVATADVGHSPYISFSVAAACEIPVKLINVILIKFCPRRMALFGTFFIITLVMIALIILPTGYPWVELALLIVGKMCTSANGAIFRVHISEVYPTVVRSVALGVCITIGRVGTVIAPFFDDLSLITYPWMSKAITSVLCLSCALATRLTQETFKKALQDNFDTNEPKAAESARSPDGNTCDA